MIVNQSTGCFKGTQIRKSTNTATSIRSNQQITTRKTIICKASIKFPSDYPEAIRQAQQATEQALKDGKMLLEIDFPTASLASVAGDAEGANEMNYSLNYLRQYCRIFQTKADSTRIFFPDYKEMLVASQGKGMDPNAGSWTIDPVFNSTKFKLDYLTKPSGLLDIGIDISGYKPSEKVKSSDELLIAAYPCFDPREMIAVEQVYNGAAKQRNIPIIMFNGELDRIRTGYYPPLFYPKIGKMAKDFIPKVETVYYIHNFKGNNGGALIRSYPGPWQVFTRGLNGMKLVHEQEERLTLRQVALDILPKARNRV